MLSKGYTMGCGVSLALVLLALDLALPFALPAGAFLVAAALCTFASPAAFGARPSAALSALLRSFRFFVGCNSGSAS